MTAKKHSSILSILLVVFLFASLLNVQVARADGETPTEPPAATEVVTEAPVESSPEAVEATPVPEQATPVPAASEAPVEQSASDPTLQETPVAGILSDVPEDTTLVVLDEEGQPIALGSQETADAVVEADPVWCPASVFPPTPGANGCSANYPSISDLLTAMRTTPAAFSADGTIYLEKTGEDTDPAYTPFTTPLILDDSASSLSGAFSTLSSFNWTIRGGWDQTAIDPFDGTNTFFDGSGVYIAIGSAGNPWVGNITLKDITVANAALANSLTIYTSSGDITLSDVDVKEQTGEHYTAYLSTGSGDIVVQDRSSYDGNDTGVGTNSSKGFYASSTSGSISITGAGGTAFTFRDSEGLTPGTRYNGATLSAPTVTLNNVVAAENDGNGIAVSGASLVTLTNVASARNANNQGAGLSGILVNGTGSTVVNLFGGTLADNGRFGIEVLNATLYVHTAPTCPTTGNTRNGLGCYNVTPATPPAQPTPTQPTPTQPTPTQPTPTQPTPTQPTPTGPAPTEATPTAPVPTEATPAAPASGSSTPEAPTSSSSSQAASQNVVIPLTGGGLVDLNCNSVFWAGGIKLSFINLCDQQTSIEGVNSDDLPGDLPDGASFVAGLNVSILSDGQALETLPDGAGIQLDFPTGADEEYAVLYWDEANGQWIEISQELNSGELSQALSGTEGAGLYQLVDNVADLFLQILTTDKTGIFVLVKK